MPPTQPSLFARELPAGMTLVDECDAPPFGIIAGISLAAPCRFRLKHRGDDRRASIELPPRSAYVLAGEVRDEWEHSIPPVEQLRHSITFRTRP